MNQGGIGRLGTTLCSIVLGLTAAVAGAADFYAATNGNPGGNGSLSNPWDLQTALNQPSSVHAGDTIWVRGGTYAGTFDSYLSGTSANPIVVRQYPGERAILDGGNSAGQPMFVAWGNYSWFWGLEFMSSDPKRSTSQPGPWPTDIGRGGVQVHSEAGYGNGVKFINCVLHDLSGSGLPTFSLDSEFYGCLLYYNGWDGPDGGHGHALYVQNQTSTKYIIDNIVFQQFSHGLHAYTESSYIDNIHVEGNTFFNNGSLSTHGPARNVLIGGAVLTHNPTVIDNYMYYPNVGQPSSSFYIGYNTGCVNAVVTDNYISNTTFFPQCDPVSMTGNSFYGAITGFTQGQYPNNMYYSTRPTGVKVFIRPNQYETGRANITVYDWDLLDSVDVDLSGVLSTGDSFEIRNAQDFFGVPVVSGTYTGGTVSIPQSGLTTAAPVGWPAPPPSGPEFNAFVLLTVASGGGPTPTPTPTRTPTRTPTPAPPTATSTPTRTPTAVPPTATPTRTSTPAPTSTPGLTSTPTPTAIPTLTPTPTATPTETPIPTSGPSATPTPTGVATAASTNTPTPTPTETPSASPTATPEAATPTATPTAVASSTPNPTGGPTVTPTPTPFLIRLEAESALLEGPMTAGPDTQSFGGYYISTNTSDTGTATWNLQVPLTDDYYVWARVLSQDDQHDSFFASDDSLPEDVYDAADGNWGPNWQWTRLNGRAGTGVPLTLNPRILMLSSGGHSLVFRGREVGSKLDRLIVTADANFVPTEGNVTTFADSPPSNPFYDFIETIARNQISGGCGGGKYCPSSGVTRAQMAVFLLKSEHGSAYAPPAATGTVFSDVPANAFAAAWIEQLHAEGITSGCGGSRYCPNAIITRAQMAVFLLRAEHGADYVPPPAVGLFGDLVLSDPFTPWIEQLSVENVTAGCGNGNYCPNAANTRGQMAVFLVRTFHLQ